MTNFRVHAYYSVQHADEPMAVRSPEGVDSLIDALSSGKGMGIMAVLHSQQRKLLPSGFPDHEFLVGADGGRKVGVVSFIDVKNYLSIDSTNTFGGEVVYHVADNPREFPATAEIPLALVREAVKEFLLSGGRRPTCIEWQEEPGV
ncbi:MULTISPECIES: Imm1 family immunity protein [unclassified Streptomyces]|uniref:Imm1 family immunity protein n=1 Tax=unclassified Streptomyces TaxID=2593676 RepID=UPI00093AA3C7|nr:Imm1 family immunity protein [Streptomyces sp. CB02058]